ncbi:MAG: TolC family protein [Bacteroidetes bacterium HGW-Bacteroidetes-17]|jgi:outer membrane protein TolC|nr:MAG: TolC family protein [Bacteroidetes bacterium HGW-Bacteroidetes-17]
MRFIYLSLIIITSLSSIKAQTVYGLKDCIGIGLERNFSLRVARNSESITKNNYTKGNAGYLPSLDLSSRYSGTLNNTTQNLVDGSQTKTNGVNNTTANAALALGWTIFDGFSVQTTYKKLGELEQLGALNTQMSAENLIANIISGYYNYIQQVQMLNNMKYAMELSKERLRIDEERYLLGSSSKLQVLQSRVYLNADSSKLSKQFEVVRTAQIGLNELMAVEDLGTEFITKDATIDVIEQFIYEKLLEETLMRNTSLLIASKNKVVSEYDYKLIESRSYPYLSLSSGYSYNLNTYSNSTNKNQITNGMNYGLTLGMNLFDGFNQRRSLNNSSIEIQNKELKYAEVEQGVKADLISIYNAYTNNLRLINLEEQNVQTATENLDIALESYKLGSLSGLELREVQKSLLDAKDRLFSIHYQAKLAEISLQLISGNIMAYYE